jgi:hypothetical protein
VAHAAVDAAMKALLVLAALVLLTATAASLGLGTAAAAGAGPVPAQSPTTPLTGNVSGPTVVAASSNVSYYINGTGGPAFLNGEQVGNLTWRASVSGTNTTVVTVKPTSGAITNHTPANVTVDMGPIYQTITLTVELQSTNHTANDTTNLTYVIHIVQPYTLTLHLVVGSSAGIASFNLTIDLDGVPVGAIRIPTLGPGTNDTANFDYATLGLSPGTHTFTASLVAEHGLVTFAGGSTTLSESFYVPGAPPSYTVWYVAGIAAFFGALFIIVTRVAARRQRPTKK